MSNVDVKITADVVDLQAKFAIAKAESSALTSELNKLAKEAAQAGGTMSNETKAGLTAAAEASVRAKAEMAQLGSQIKQTHESNLTFSGGLNLVKGGLAALGVSVTAGALINFAENVEVATAQLQHEAEVLQLTVTAYQAYRNAAIDSGVETDVVDGAIKKFSKSVGEASVGTGKAAIDFFNMGISLNQSKEAILQQVAAYMLHADWQERDRLAVEIFSRSGAEMLPLLDKWSQGVDDLTKKYDEQGRMLDPGVTSAAHEADIALAQAWQHMQTAAAGPVASLTSALAGLIEKLAQFKQVGGAVGGVVVVQPQDINPPTPKPAPGAGVPIPKPKPDETADDLAVLSSINPKIKERAD